MNKIKIVTTIGPSSMDKEIIKQLIINGTDVFRINLSHADYPFCIDTINKIDELNKELNTNVAVMLDTKGPEIRTHKFMYGEAFFKQGDKIRVYMEELLGDNTKFSIDTNILIEAKLGSFMRIADGSVEFKIIGKGTDYLLCEVIKEGIIGNTKSVSVSDLKLNKSFLSEKDRQDILFASKSKVDFLALSFVRSSEDVLEVNDILINQGNDHLGIIAKIETEEAVNDIDNIINVSEGIMVARGDLGVEMSIERIPGIQKKIINKCHIAGIVSIVATELLSGMEDSLVPTRAEVSDIANAVLDGADAVVLCGETTIGKYPVQTLQMMEKIIKSAELDINYNYLMEQAIKTEKRDMTGTLSYSVAGCANKLQCKAIFAPTISGYTARKISRFRPFCPIIAISPNVETVKSLALHFGVIPVLVDELNSLDKIIKKSKEVGIKLIDLKKDDKIIITGGYPFKEVKHTNFMKIEEI